jgi:hypothetical protein
MAAPSTTKQPVTQFRYNEVSVRHINKVWTQDLILTSRTINQHFYLKCRNSQRRRLSEMTAKAGNQSNGKFSIMMPLPIQFSERSPPHNLHTAPKLRTREPIPQLPPIHFTFNSFCSNISFIAFTVLVRCQTTKEATTDSCLSALGTPEIVC